MLRNIKISVLLLCCVAFQARAQEAGFETINLATMSSFKPQAGNWKIVGGVVIDPLVDVHHGPAPQPDGYKKSKKKKEEVSMPKAVTFTEGTGILLNLNDEQKKDNLITVFDHGDIELEMEVMVPKGSNSGLYLQGRYEVQLTDSWGVLSPKFSDMGGIYRNWESDPAKAYTGKAPLANSCKAPGLWQSIKISFRAPRFDSNGKKIANAKFILVQLNGITLHENVEVPTLTGGPIASNEVAEGPLMIQGDHGPIAFRNMRYKKMHDIKSTISPVAYKIYHGTYKTIAEYIPLKPVLVGSSDVLTCEVLDVDNQYGIVYTGSITVPEDAHYTVSINTTGSCRLVVNGERSTQADRWERDWVTVLLKAGTYPFEIYNLKKDSWTPPRMAMFIQTATSYAQPLQAYNSFPPDENPVYSIYVNPGGNATRLLRAFLDFKGDRGRRLSHTIGVGDPTGVNYVYDLKSGNLVCVWRGDFVDATPMWHDRGDGSFRPVGAPEYLFMNAPLSTLDNQSQAFANPAPEADFRPRGYRLDEATGRPTFIYEYKGLSIEDSVYPENENKTLQHKITLKDASKVANLYYKVAEGKDIVKLANGYYAVDNNRYYIKFHTAQEPQIRNLNGTNELLVPLKENTLHYSIIW